MRISKKIFLFVFLVIFISVSCDVFEFAKKDTEKINIQQEPYNTLIYLSDKNLEINNDINNLNYDKIDMALYNNNLYTMFLSYNRTETYKYTYLSVRKLEGNIWKDTVTSTGNVLNNYTINVLTLPAGCKRNYEFKLITYNNFLYAIWEDISNNKTVIKMKRYSEERGWHSVLTNNSDILSDSTKNSYLLTQGVYIFDNDLFIAYSNNNYNEEIKEYQLVINRISDNGTVKVNSMAVQNLSLGEDFYNKSYDKFRFFEFKNKLGIMFVSYYNGANPNYNLTTFLLDNLNFTITQENISHKDAFLNKNNLMNINDNSILSYEGGLYAVWKEGTELLIDSYVGKNVNKKNIWLDSPKTLANVNTGFPYLMRLKNGIGLLYNDTNQLYMNKLDNNLNIVTSIKLMDTVDISTYYGFACQNTIYFAWKKANSNSELDKNIIVGKINLR